MSASICESIAKGSTILSGEAMANRKEHRSRHPASSEGGAHPQSIQSFRRSWLFVLSISSCGSDRLFCCFPEPINALIGLKSSIKRRARESRKWRQGTQSVKCPTRHSPIVISRKCSCQDRWLRPRIRTNQVSLAFEPLLTMKTTRWYGYACPVPLTTKIPGSIQLLGSVWLL